MDINLQNELGYLKLLKEVLETGDLRSNRTDVPALSIFGSQLSFSLKDHVMPFLTTKKMHFKNTLHELLWVINGDTNIKYLNDHDVHIWDEWADPNGDLGPIYGEQWRKCPMRTGKPIDQLTRLIKSLKKDPYSRRHIISSWNVGELYKIRLHPCHILCQFYVAKNRELQCHMYQRSADMFLGVPYDIAFYSLLTHILATILDFTATKLIISFGDVHLYKNHIDQAETQLTRTPTKPPTIKILNYITSIEDLDYRLIKLIGYESQPALPGAVAI